MIGNSKVLPWTLVAIFMLAAACGENGDPPESSGSQGEGPSSFQTPFDDAKAYPVFISSEIVVGENRFLVGLLNQDDAPIGTPDIDVQVSFYDLDASGNQITQSKDLDFIWSTVGKRGVYVTEATFTHPGEWGAEVAIEGKGLDETVRASFDVAQKPITPAVGDQAPKSDTPTADDVADLSEISTDPHPDPSFYEMSIADAVGHGRPTVVTFATPKFCTSAVCGPTLDIVKKVSHGIDDANFIHVEVFENLDDPSNLKPVPAVVEWKLRTEPWVFVVDGDGRIAAKFEGIVGAEELRTALRRIQR
jgi:hypothetical protein